MNPYQPNIDDPRVRKRIRHAYGFACAVLSETKPHAWSTRYIDRYFGQQQNPLSQWLRDQLLICTRQQWNKDTGQCKEYLLNQSGAHRIRSLLQVGTVSNSEIPSELDILAESNHRIFDQQCVARFIDREYRTELTTGQFHYDDKCSRLWHPIQNIRNQYRSQLLTEHGYSHHYDIECSAPTLIHQHAQQQADPMDLYLFALREYLGNRTEVRKHIAQQADMEIRQVKVLINALFCGARLGHNPDFAISQLLDNDSGRIEYLKQDPFITELRSDIKTCWEYIAPSMMRRSQRDRNNRERLLPITSREKWMRYFDLERTVLNSIMRYMNLNEIRYFLEHDGWSADREMDLDAVRAHVENETGFQLNFDYKPRLTHLNRMRSLRDLVE